MVLTGQDVPSDDMTTVARKLSTLDEWFLEEVYPHRENSNFILWWNRLEDDAKLKVQMLINYRINRAEKHGVKEMHSFMREILEDAGKGVFVNTDDDTSDL